MQNLRDTGLALISIPPPKKINKLNDFFLMISCFLFLFVTANTSYSKFLTALIIFLITNTKRKKKEKNKNTDKFSCEMNSLKIVNKLFLCFPHLGVMTKWSHVQT